MSLTAKRRNYHRLVDLPFCPDKAKLWFKIIELQFSAKKTFRANDKFSYVIAMLGENYIFLAENILRNCPETDLYRYLKRKILERVAIWSKDDYSVKHMAGKNPSKFFRFLRKVNMAHEKYLVKLWKTALPKQVRKEIKAVEKEGCTTTVCRKMMEQFKQVKALVQISQQAHEKFGSVFYERWYRVLSRTLSTEEQEELATRDSPMHSYAFSDNEEIEYQGKKDSVSIVKRPTTPDRICMRT
ncbi:hypothetical protein TSAR_000445 [Trichomalopsis sarcophagae]|uniref:DUF7041 domain-containing protein n=1 Tax=Trichomalopsis sarcophagae TaxID=543379 RepID=A0A232FL14_9HYME|nr:hypothetical protein TSAR_000445 [Trichomalopsis sarcophagae]